MKGLVFKDLLLMKKMNKKVIFVMYFFVIAISFFGENEVYSIMSSAFFSLFIGMHLMMTMTYDGLTSWKRLAPVQSDLPLCETCLSSPHH